MRDVGSAFGESFAHRGTETRRHGDLSDWSLRQRTAGPLLALGVLVFRSASTGSIDGVWNGLSSSAGRTPSRLTHCVSAP